mgnify:CR=1 FL=1
MTTIRSLFKLTAIVLRKCYSDQLLDEKLPVTISNIVKNIKDFKDCCITTSTVLAASNGHLDCLKYAHENGCEWDQEQKHYPPIFDDFETGFITAFKTGFNFFTRYKTAYSCLAAAANGHLDCLKYAHENGCKLDKYTSLAAASNGHLDCLIYANENNENNDWDYHTCLLSIHYFNCFLYVFNNNNWLEEERLRVVDITRYAAEIGQLDCLRYAHENGCELTEVTCIAAAANGHLDCLKYAHENGCEWDKDTCLYAARNGHLNCLKYAHENGCEWDEDTCFYAIYEGHWDCFKYAYDNGCDKYNFELLTKTKKIKKY